MWITKKEERELKREVKNATGMNMKDIEIEAFGNDFCRVQFLQNKL